MPIDIREQVAILEVDVLKFHWLVLAGVMCQNLRELTSSAPSAYRRAGLELEVAATKRRSRKAIAKQCSRANRVH